MGAGGQLALAAGTTIIQQGDTADHFYVLAEGKVEVVIDGEVKKQLDAPNSFGELSLIFDQAATATIRASSDVVVWSLTPSAFRTIQAVTSSNSISQRHQSS